MNIIKTLLIIVYRDKFQLIKKRGEKQQKKDRRFKIFIVFLKTSFSWLENECK